MKFVALSPADKRLRQNCTELSKRQLRAKLVQEEIEELLNFVYGQNNKGPARNRRRPATVGLSANQVGVMKQISIVDLAIGRKGFYDLHALINPRIIWQSKAKVGSTEGCVNLPEIWGKVERFKRVKVQALDRSGNRLVIDASGLPAILLQHEIDHLHGRLFIDHLPDPTLAQRVTPATIKDYNKKNRASWPHHVDVSQLARPLKP